MHKVQRKQKILEYLKKNGSAGVLQLAEMMNCSTMTIRRDLGELAQEGLVNKVHGGVLAVNRIEPAQGEIIRRMQENIEEKRRIAAKAIQYIKEDVCVFFDAGTTPFYIAQALPMDSRFSAITCSLMTAVELCKRPNINVIMLGGELHNSTMSVINKLALDITKTLTADMALISTKAINPDEGLLETVLPLIEVKRLMVMNSDYTMVVADASKFEETAMCLSIPISQVNQIITTKTLNSDTVAKLRRRNIVVDLV